MQLRRGVNIEGWLGGYHRPPEERICGFLREDAERMARLGFDHIRVNVNSQHLWDDDSRHEWTFEQVDRLLDDCEDLGLKAIFDLHTLPSHTFADRTGQALFEDQACADEFVRLWMELSDWLGRRSTDVLAYEFLNEPIAYNHEDWNRVMWPVHEALRAKEPERTLVLGSNEWSQPETFQHLRIPEDPKVTLTLHFYRPMLLTHYKCKPFEWGFYEGDVHYPGVPIHEEDVAAMTEEQREAIAPHNIAHDQAFLEGWIKQAAENAAGHPVYCGEFGVIWYSPRPDRLRWFRDIMPIFKKYDMGWSVYSYKGWAGVLDRENKEDTELLEMLLA